MRCYICDYSPEVQDQGVDKKLKLVYDKKTGKEICTDCLKYVKATLKSYPDTKEQ